MKREGMRMNAPKGQKVSYVEQTDAPWGGVDPRGLLDPGGIYTVDRTIVYRSVSFVKLAEYPDYEFNLMMFEESSPHIPAVQTVEEVYKEGLLLPDSDT